MTEIHENHKEKHPISIKDTCKLINSKRNELEKKLIEELNKQKKPVEMADLLCEASFVKFLLPLFRKLSETSFPNEKNENNQSIPEKMTTLQTTNDFICPDKKNDFINEEKNEESKTENIISSPICIKKKNSGFWIKRKTV